MFVATRVRKTVRQTRTLAVLSLVFSADIVACNVTGSRRSQADIKISNAIDVPQAFPSVVKLTNSDGAECTGTFIAPDLVLTAAHCIGSEWTGLSAEKPIKARDIFVHDGHCRKVGGCGDAGPNDFTVTDTSRDLALLLFDSNAAPDVAAWAPTDPKQGDAPLAVGFGDGIQELLGNGKMRIGGSGIKRCGQTKFINIAMQPDPPQHPILHDAMLINTEGGGALKSVSSGLDAVIGSGDSGGPLFLEGIVVGVTTTGGFKASDMTRLEGQYVRLADERNALFLMSVSSLGAQLATTKVADGSEVLRVVDVAKQGPAAAAGILAGDTLIKASRGADGQITIASVPQLLAILTDNETDLIVTVARGSAQVELTIHKRLVFTSDATIHSKAMNTFVNCNAEDLVGHIAAIDELGIVLGAARRLDAGTLPFESDADKALRLLWVQSGSVAAKAGLRSGDIVSRIDGTRIFNIETAKERLTGMQNQTRTLRVVARLSIDATMVDFKPDGQAFVSGTQVAKKILSPEERQALEKKIHDAVEALNQVPLDIVISGS